MMKKTYESPKLFCDDFAPDTLIASSGFDPFEPVDPGKGGNGTHNTKPQKSQCQNSWK